MTDTIESLRADLASVMYDLQAWDDACEGKSEERPDIAARRLVARLVDPRRASVLESLRAEFAAEREETERWRTEVDRIKAEMKRRSIAAVQAVTSLVVARYETDPEGARITELEAELAAEKEARQRAEEERDHLLECQSGFGDALYGYQGREDRLLAIEREARALVDALEDDAWIAAGKLRRALEAK